MFGQKGQNAQDVGDLDGDGDVDEDDVKIQYQRVCASSSHSIRSSNPAPSFPSLWLSEELSTSEHVPTSLNLSDSRVVLSRFSIPLSYLSYLSTC